MGETWAGNIKALMKKSEKALGDRYQKTVDVDYSSLVHIKDL